MKMSTLLAAIVMLGASGAAVAGRDGGVRGNHDANVGLYQEHGNGGDNGDRFARHADTTLQAPEIDSASLVVALTLLGGGLLVLRGPRTSKPAV